MDKPIIFFVISLFLIIFTQHAFGFLEQGWQNLFCKIALFGTSNLIECDNMKDTLTLKQGSGILLDFNSTTDTITITASIQGDGNTAQIGDAGNGVSLFANRENATKNNLKTLRAGNNIIITPNSTDIIISAADSAGEANTASNIGTGEGQVFRDKTGVTLNFKTLKAGSNIVITNNPDEILIASSLSNTFGSANNVGSGELAFIANNNTKIDIKRLDCDSTLNCFNGTSSNTIGVATISQSQVTNLITDLAAKQSRSEKNQNHGYAGLGSNGRLNKEQQNGTTEYTTNKGIADGYASLNNNALVPSSQLGSGTNSSTTYLRGDRTWATISTGITSINSQTGSSQTLQGTSRNVTVTSSSNTHTFNLGDLVVIISGAAQTITKALTLNNLILGGQMDANSQNIVSVGSIQTGTDPADAGRVRLSNNERIAWEASPAGTDVALQVDANEDFLFDSSANNINLNSNPMINSILNIDSTGNQITSATPEAGDLLKSDGTEFQRFAKGSAGTCLKVNAAGTDLEYGTCSSGGGEANTASNIGTGTVKLFHSKSGVDLRFKTVGTTRGIELTNGTDTADISTNFKVNSKSSAVRQFLTSFNNATTDGNFGTVTFGVDNLSSTCSGTDKVSAITFNNSTGDWTVTCSTDQTGSGGGGGNTIPYDKAWGYFVARSTTGSLNGFLTGATLDGTETYTYDTTMASSAISSASGTTAGNNAGVSQVAANTNIFRLDQNALVYAEFRMTEITTQRIFIGFHSGTTALPNANDDFLNAASGAGLCVRSTDTVYQFCYNDGTGATVFSSLTTTEDTNRHTIKIYAESANNRWCASLDGGTAVCSSTDIPAATTRLFLSVAGETTDTSGTTFMYSKIYVQNDR